MILIMSASNRKGSNSGKIASFAYEHYKKTNVECELIDLHDVPHEIFMTQDYQNPPAIFKQYQDLVLKAKGILVVVPEYNGSFPGVMKYFIDLLKFPESLYETPAAFIGLAAGHFAALRPVEQLEMIFQFRKAHLYGERLFIPNCYEQIQDDGSLKDEDLNTRQIKLLDGFNQFVTKLS